MGFTQGQNQIGDFQRPQSLEVELVVKEVSRQIHDNFPDFGRTTLQLNKDSRPQAHIDAHVISNSTTIALGPCTGGWLPSSEPIKLQAHALGIYQKAAHHMQYYLSWVRDTPW